MLGRMARVPYDPEHIARFFDEYGTREWERFDATPIDRVGARSASSTPPRAHPRRRSRPRRGSRPGRFTLELARLGAIVVAGDISPRQLDLHAEMTASVDASIEARQLLDILDLGGFPGASFDAVVCFGGPLSYVLGEADAALDELLRVTKPGGHVLLSVMSLLGAARAFFDQLPPLVDEFGWKRAVTDIFETGDLDGEINKGHVCRLYRWSSLEALLQRHPRRIVTASAANFLSVGNDAWDDRFLEVEIEACREPGALDGGTHILAVVERI